MNRRDFVALAGAAAAFPRVAFAQQAAKVPRVAVLSIPELPQVIEAFNQGLADFGYTDGKNIAIELFTAPTTVDLPAFAARAVASKPDVILTQGTPASQAAQAATNTIPIVFTAINDPLGVGLISSLAHPGGNITGDTLLAPDLVGKQLALAKEIIPSLQRLAVLNLPANPSAALLLDQVRAGSKALNLEPVVIDFTETEDFATQFAKVMGAGAQAVYQLSLTYFTDNRQLIFSLLVADRLPLISSGIIEGLPFGGFVAYGPSTTASWRRSVSFIDAILKGAKPGDLPVEQPTVFDFVVNLATAKAIGITIPPSILAQATQVVQ